MNAKMLDNITQTAVEKCFASNDYAISLDDDTFNSMKSQFDGALTDTLTAMQEQAVNEASIALKLSVKLFRTYRSLEDKKRVCVPSFEHKITATIQHKSEVTGLTGGSNYELVWDETLEKFFMRKPQDPQVDLFD